MIMQGKNGYTFLQGHCLNDGALFFLHFDRFFF